mmetsp:Transcript_32682/g.49948  ORF Transcript_32682/g.49948 Transcript_32682/m.49948 type:complete len:425 (-) Transcript_32682:202-1476(-)|eukprot:CAMPEP_0170491738 /NCGR_PEP_ID=MMETSP0208-20121228/11224_1 /TAXON_ID=197538 /ORGANISM="Strombidium inclinatum, Strain S3" /LENGTH=424 /DNA_ID=CAMNT_0010767359 /DNA_START=244 /DNA_END=1518 /DNA_ORIENTATION=-
MRGRGQAALVELVGPHGNAARCYRRSAPFGFGSQRRGLGLRVKAMRKSFLRTHRIDEGVLGLFKLHCCLRKHSAAQLGCSFALFGFLLGSLAFIATSFSLLLLLLHWLVALPLLVGNLEEPLELFLELPLLLLDDSEVVVHGGQLVWKFYCCHLELTDLILNLGHFFICHLFLVHELVVLLYSPLLFNFEVFNLVLEAVEHNLDFLEVNSVHVLGFLEFSVHCAEALLRLLDLSLEPLLTDNLVILQLDSILLVLEPLLDEELGVAHLADVALRLSVAVREGSAFVAAPRARDDRAELAGADVFRAFVLVAAAIAVRVLVLGLVPILVGLSKGENGVFHPVEDLPFFTNSGSNVNHKCLRAVHHGVDHGHSIVQVVASSELVIVIVIIGVLGVQTLFEKIEELLLVLESRLEGLNHLNLSNGGS